MSRIYSSNSHVVNTSAEIHSKSTPLQRLSGGSQVVSPLIQKFHNLDKLVVGYFIDHSGSFFFPQLDEAKLQARELSADVPIILAGKEFVLSATANRFFPYIIKTGDITILFSKREPNGKTPNLKIEVGSMSCWTNYQLALESFIDFIQSLGCKFEYSEIVNRCDLCCDLVGLSITEIAIRNENYWITRSEGQDNYFKESLSNKQLNALTIAPYSPVRLVIYNKVDELKHNERKQSFFSRVWEKESYNSSPVVRCEFQLKRDFFKKRGIRTLSDLEKSFASSWQYLTTKWCRHTSTKVDRKNKNQSHAKISPFWKMIQDTDWGELHHIEKQDDVPCNISALTNLMVGCGLKLAVIYGADPYLSYEVVSLINRIAKNKIEQMMMYEHKKYDLKVRKVTGELLTGI